MKINSKIHGLIDYVVVLFLFSAPTLFGLPEITSVFTYVLGVIHLLLTITTRFEFGLIKIIPLKIHGIIELAVSVLLIAVAFYLGNLEDNISRNFYLGFAVAVFATWYISDYNNMTKN